MLLAAHFSPAPTVLPEFLSATAVSATTPSLAVADHAADQQFPVWNDSGSEEGPAQAPLTNADTFNLHSKPGSKYTVFLDFDVDVTTEDPGLDALTKSGSGDTTWGIRSLHTTNTNKVCGGCGGVAYIGSFSSSIDLPAYSFNKGVNAGGNTQSHEVGHSVRLGHDGLTSGTTYYAGHGSGNTTWGPIMGGPGSRKLKTWSNGDYYNANNQQDDLDRITTLNGFSFRSDDHGNTFAAATPLQIESTANLSEFGIIEQSNDVDLFSFRTAGGNVSFNVQPYLAHPNLDL